MDSPDQGYSECFSDFVRTLPGQELDTVRGGFFFVSRLLGVVYAAGTKKILKKHTEHERM